MVGIGPKICQLQNGDELGRIQQKGRTSNPSRHGGMDDPRQPAEPVEEKTKSTLSERNFF